MKTLYEVLGVSPTAEAEVIKAAHRALAKKSHPDHGGDAETFRWVQRAYDVLSDEKKRRAYDAQLARRAPEAPDRANNAQLARAAPEAPDQGVEDGEAGALLGRDAARRIGRELAKKRKVVDLARVYGLDEETMPAALGKVGEIIGGGVGRAVAKIGKGAGNPGKNG